MAFLEQRAIGCPYCGESIDILIEPSEGAAVGDAEIGFAEPYEYIEDCQVCCRPIVMSIAADGSGVEVRSEND